LLADVPLEVLTYVCRHLGLVDLVRVSQTCKRFRHGGMETVELPTESPVVTVLRENAFPRLELAPRTRPIGCSESWMAYLAGCVRQRRCREAPPVATGGPQTLFVGTAGRLMACGRGSSAGGEGLPSSIPSPVAAMAGVRVQSVAAGWCHSLALGCDGRVYSWGDNDAGQLGQGDKLERPVPTPVEGLVGVRGLAAADNHSFAVTLSGAVFSWGESFLPEGEDALRPITVEGFGGVRVRSGCAGTSQAFAIGEAGELFSWGLGENGLLGHGDAQNQPAPKRVEALRGVRVSTVSSGISHAIALTDDGLVYAWGINTHGAVLGNPHVERELLPKPVEALRGVRMGAIAADMSRSYAVADTGEVWAWGCYKSSLAPLDHGEEIDCPLPRPMESLRGVKVDAVAAGYQHSLAVGDDGSVYTWGTREAAREGVLGLGESVDYGRKGVRTPQRIPALRLCLASAAQ
jgi:hypothetical protein